MQRKRIRKSVIGYDKDTLEIKMYFPSTYQAGKNGFSQVQITNICNHVQYCKTCKGLCWMYEEEWKLRYGTEELFRFLEEKES